jgi:NADH:ubiquinone oxidoreductase subunit 5 (subunit L)/multisubunit Na+/H+ antiporter MnhA subunit
VDHPAAAAPGRRRQRNFWRTLAEKRRLGVALFSTTLAFLVALEVVREFFTLPADQIPWIKSYFTWISAGGFRADFALQVDQLTVIMLLVVTGVGWLIHIYSTGYMHDDPGYRRFFSYLNLFMFFMLVLILAANYLLMFVGWEGVGLCSYLLIGFYLPEAVRHQRRQQSLLGEPRRRFRIYPRPAFDFAHLRHA